MNGRARARLGPASALRVRVTLEPLHSALTALVAEVATLGHHLDPARRRHVSTYLDRHLDPDGDLRAAISAWVIPSVLLSRFPAHDLGAAEHHDYLTSTDAAAKLAVDVAELHRREEDSFSWPGPRRSPQQWMAEHAGVVLGLTEHLQPMWHGAAGALQREVERIGTATVRGTLDAALASLHPRIGWDGDTLTWPDGSDLEVDLPGGPLYLVPRTEGTDLIGSGLDEDQRSLYISYPVPGLLGPRRPQPSGDHLAQLLTPPRAGLVRALSQPRTMGELAVLLQLAPSSITHHCRRLEAAGIVVRERRGAHVRVTRTPYGDLLVDRSS